MQNDEIKNNFQKTKVAIIKYFKESKFQNDEDFFLMVFQKNIIFLQTNIITKIPNLLLYLNDLFNSNPQLSICFYPDTKNHFNKLIQIKNTEIFYDSEFQNEISAFQRAILFKNKLLNNAWKIIGPCIFGYLIKQSYEKLKFDRVDEFFKNRYSKNFQPIILKEEDYIELSNNYIGSIFSICLIYHIEREELMTIKKPHMAYDPEYDKLIKREIENYSKLSHPFLPKYYGTTKVGGYLVIEYIKGKTLMHIDELHLTFEEKITIILQISMSIAFIHGKGLIYRDLKPSNVIIDSNKTAVLIDFDRIINFNNKNQSFGFDRNFAAPEIDSNYLTSACDVYSFGQMINYIIYENDPNCILAVKLENGVDMAFINCIEKKCKFKNPQERLESSRLMIIIIFYFNSRIKVKKLLGILIELYTNIGCPTSGLASHNRSYS